MGYGVRIVRDDIMLAEDREWMFVVMVDDSIELWVANASAGSARVLSEVCTAVQTMEHAEIPAQRAPHHLEMREAI